MQKTFREIIISKPKLSPGIKEETSLQCDLFTSITGSHSVWGGDSILNHKEMERSEFKRLWDTLSQEFGNIRVIGI